MRRIAVVGLEGAGKSVLVAALIRSLRDAESMSQLSPLSVGAQAGLDATWDSLRRGVWPRSIPLMLETSWSCERIGKSSISFQVCDFPGSAIGTAFSNRTSRAERSTAENELASLFSADAAVVVVNPADFLPHVDRWRRADNEQTLLNLVNHLRMRPMPCPIAIAIAQADLYRDQCEEARSPEGLLCSLAPTVAAAINQPIAKEKVWGERFVEAVVEGIKAGLSDGRAIPAISVFWIAAVNCTHVTLSEDGRAGRIPHPAFASEGVGLLRDWLLKVAEPPVLSAERRNQLKTWIAISSAAFVVSTPCILFSWFVAPKATIVESRAYRHGFVWQDIVVEGTVRNSGFRGKVTVYAVVKASSHRWRKVAEVDIPSNETSTFKVTFEEYEAGTATYGVTTSWWKSLFMDATSRLAY